MRKKKQIIIICGVVVLTIIIGLLLIPTTNIKELPLTNTYTTRFATTEHVTAPTFQFDYSDNWKITKEELNSKIETIYEVVELSNERGVIIRYVQFNHNTLHVGTGRDMMQCKITRLSDSSLKRQYVQSYDYSSQEALMVAKVHELTYGDVAGKYERTKIDRYLYAVVPESYVDVDSYIGADEWRLNKFSFQYGSSQSFVAHSPDGSFTDSEEKEIIKILSSFREMPFDTIN